MLADALHVEVLCRPGVDGDRHGAVGHFDRPVVVDVDGAVGVVPVRLFADVEPRVVVPDGHSGLHGLPQVAVDLRAHHAADGAVAGAGNPGLVPLGALDALSVGGPVLGVLGEDGLVPHLGGAVHFHLAGDAHPDVVLSEEGAQHVHDLGADAVFHSLLELHLQRRDLAVQGVLRQIDVAQLV